MTDSQSPPSLPATGRRAQLIDVARRLLLRDGYARTSVSAIVREAGVAQGTFYLYFDSKEQLLAELRREVFHQYLHAFQSHIAGDGPADSRLVATARALYDQVHATRALVRVFHQAATGEETERTVLAGRDRLAEPLAELLQAGSADGSFDTTVPHMHAHLILALFDNLFYEALEFARPAPGPVVLAEGLRFVLAALGVPARRRAALLSTLPDPGPAA